MKKFNDTKDFWSYLDENANKTFSEDIDQIIEGIKNFEEIQYDNCAKLFIADAKRKLYFKILLSDKSSDKLINHL